MFKVSLTNTNCSPVSNNTSKAIEKERNSPSNSTLPTDKISVTQAKKPTYTDVDNKKIIDTKYLSKTFGETSEINSNYIMSNLSSIALCATVDELKEIYSYMLVSYPYDENAKIYANITDRTKLNDVERKAVNIISFYAAINHRKDFQNFVKDDPKIIASINKIDYEKNKIDKDDLKSASGVYIRYITKRLTAIAAFVNNNLPLVESSIKYAMDHFRINFNCCKQDLTYQDKLLEVFLQNLFMLKPEAVEHYVKSYIDIFKENMNHLKCPIYIIRNLISVLAINVLEDSSFSDLIHKYLRTNSQDIIDSATIGGGLFDYKDSMLTICRNIRPFRDNMKSSQEWNHTIWQLLKQHYDPSKINNKDVEDSRFFCTSLNIIAVSHALNDRRYNREVLEFFKNTPVGIFLDQCEKFLFDRQNYDLDIIKSIDEKDIHFSLWPQLRSLKSEGRYKITIKDVKKLEQYTSNECATMENLIHVVGDHTGAKVIFNKTDTDRFSVDFSLMICYVLLGDKDQIFKKINDSNFSTKAKSWLYSLAAQTFLAHEDTLSLARKHINKAITLDPKNSNFVALRKIIEIQTSKNRNVISDVINEKDSIKTNNNLSQITTKNENKDEETITNFSNNAILAQIDTSQEDDTQDIVEFGLESEENLLATSHPSEDHRYWQKVKQNRINELPSVTGLGQSNALVSEVVNLGGYSIDLSQTKTIYNRFDVKYHIYVPLKTQQELGKEYSLFENAINKGFVRYTEGQSGIKFFGEGAKKGTAEVKVKSSSHRLLGKLFSNVMIFSQVVDHKKAKKKAKK